MFGVGFEAVVAGRVTEDEAAVAEDEEAGLAVGIVFMGVEGASVSLRGWEL